MAVLPFMGYYSKGNYNYTEIIVNCQPTKQYGRK